MKILIVSGFLGAGKTTFIKEMIRRTGKQLVVLENEYGENDLDSRALKETGELKIMEFMEGCICCSKKDSFANTVLAISAGLDPEYLVVEPTGVGRLSSILDNVRKVSYDRIQLLDPVVVLAPRSIDEYLRAYPEIYRDQIGHAGRIVFSKTENEDADMIEAARARLHELNPEAEIIDVPYAQKDDGWWDSLLELPEEGGEREQIMGADFGDFSSLVGFAGGERTRTPRRRTHLRDGADESGMMQATLREGEVKSASELIVLLEDVLRGGFGEIVRAKGVLKAGGEWLRYDLADRLYGIISEESAAPVTQNVFIGRHIDEGALRSRLHADVKNIGYTAGAAAAFAARKN
ncbi:MAG: GTP-binding protein [Clostridia bacterium]|nr:GTP-binding protein [Clostridia bacterium]